MAQQLERLGLALRRQLRRLRPAQIVLALVQLPQRRQALQQDLERLLLLLRRRRRWLGWLHMPLALLQRLLRGLCKLLLPQRPPAFWGRCLPLLPLPLLLRQLLLLLPSLLTA